MGSYYPGDQELEDRGGQHHHAAAGGVGVGGNNSSYLGSGYQMNLASDAAVDESRGRSPDPRPGRAGGGGGRGGAHNPFDDDAAEPSNISLRGISPRPIDTRKTTPATGAGGGPTHESPTSISERRSVFVEDV